MSDQTCRVLPPHLLLKINARLIIKNKNSTYKPKYKNNQAKLSNFNKFKTKKIQITVL